MVRLPPIKATATGKQTDRFATLAYFADEETPEWRTEYEQENEMATYKALRTARGDRAGGKADDEQPADEEADEQPVEDEEKPQLIHTIADWENRDLPEPDCLMGEVFTTTSRILLSADTGLGKTMFGMALGMRMSACIDFLHWQGMRISRALYIDGEMSRRLLKRRILDEAEHVGKKPETFSVVSSEDLELNRSIPRLVRSRSTNSSNRSAMWTSLSLTTSWPCCRATILKKKLGPRHCLGYVH